MTKAAKAFQIFAKPGSYRCNLNCTYCYYLGKSELFAEKTLPRMTNALLERYIHQHIDAHPGEIVQFSWHGGEPTILGLDYFRHIVALQQKYCPPDKYIANGIQTNGILVNDDWAVFFATHRFSVGLSLDGPREIHDRYRRTRKGLGSHDAAMRGYACLVKHGVFPDILCVVNDYNVMFPLQVYRFFTSIGIKHLSFLPLVECVPGGVSDRTVAPEAFGAFLCTIFDKWLAKDIGTIKVQIFEEATRVAFAMEHSLCLFRPTCGDIPVVEYNGDIYACDHFVQPSRRVGNIQETPLIELLGSARLAAFGKAKRATLPRLCRSCEVLAMCNGECPKNRFVTIEGEVEQLNYLCAGYKHFFSHCAPFVEAVSRQWQKPAESSGLPVTTAGRNDPCPCGSGRKFKRCCGSR